jgi:antitoxin FitA
VATLPVRNVDDDIARRLRVRAAFGERDSRAARERAAERLAEFRRRTAGRGSASSGEVLREVRSERMRALTGTGEDT